MHRFVFTESLSEGATVLLGADQSHHIAKVIRLEEGEEVALIDGQGQLAHGTLVEVRSKATSVRISKVERSAPAHQVRLCFGVSKGQALDFIFHRATELGVSAFVPLLTQHSSPAKGWNNARWMQVVAETCKQCEELHFPEVAEPQSLQTFLQTRDPKRAMVLCDEKAREGEPLPALPRGVDVVVGAEGGFHAAEVELLRNSGAVLLGLGRNRLRAETAALVALTLIKKHTREL